MRKTIDLQFTRRGSAWFLPFYLLTDNDPELEQAERNKTVLVFQNNHPIFTIPIVAINPNEGSSKVYGILDTEDNRHSAYKFTQENTILWRIFFWDKLKASDNGECISYRGTISRTSSDQLS